MAGFLPPMTPPVSPPPRLASPPNVPPRWLRRIAGAIAGSFLLRNGRRLMERNRDDFFMPMSRWEKLIAGVQLILDDYSRGLFPPTFPSADDAHEGERAYYESVPGASKEAMREAHMRKPFWSPPRFESYSRSFVRLWRTLEGLGLGPGSRLLELGCGCGWMSEFLSIAGYRMVGTSIGPEEISLARRRTDALRARGLDPLRLSFRVSPMETVDEAMVSECDFDGVFVFEALHHAFDWRQAIPAAFRCLRPGGWLLVAGEPNRIHTFVSYRVSRLANTHEVGMSRDALVDAMRQAGFREVRVLQPRWDFGVRRLWIAAKR